MKKKIVLKDINIRSLFKENMTDEEKQMAKIIEEELQYNQKIDELEKLDFEKKKKEFESFEIKSKIDEKYVLRETELFRQEKWMLDCRYISSGTILNDIVDMLLFLYEKFDCVRTEYPWMKESLKDVEYEQ